MEEASYSRKLSPASDNIFIVALNPSNACWDVRQAYGEYGVHARDHPVDDDDGVDNNGLGCNKVGWPAVK